MGGAEIFNAVFAAVAEAYQVAIIWATSGIAPPCGLLTDDTAWFLLD